MFKLTKGERTFNVFLYIFVVILAAIFIYPFWTVVMQSLNDATDLIRGGVYLWPRKFSLENFKIVFADSSIIRAYGISIARTVLGTVLHVLATGTFAYALSKKYLMFRNFYLTLCIITMFFGGGLIPSVINMRNLGFQDNFLVYIIPGMYSIMDMILMKSFFNSLPASLEEAARIDGANDLKIFFKVVMPNSKPVVATIALMTAVGQWNSWFDAYIYVQDKELQPMQLILQQVVMSAQGASDFSGSASGAVTPYSVQLATMVVAIGPIIFIYPFFQRYFVKGFMMGSVKE